MASGPSTGRKLLLLTSQAFVLGLTLAWITVPASAIFLERFGSGVLPVTYIGAAAAGAATTALLGRALRRRPLASVAVSVLSLVCAVLVASWALLRFGDAVWVSAVLMVLVPIVVPVGFVFLVGQAGALLDVRALKTRYPRVIAGFALGCSLGGLAGSPLLSVLGRTEHVLLAAAAACAAFIALVRVTLSAFPAELSTVDEPESETPPVNLRSLLRNRFVVLIMAFQMLSAIESQWLDFLVYDRAAARYPDTRELAEFVGRFNAIAYGADIVFLLLMAGVLLRKHGLKYGLTANPVAVLFLVVATVTTGVVLGSGATIVFVLVVATRVIDLVICDGATRTAVGAAYQAVPTPERLAAQANVEGMAVPIAIGFSGVVLLVARATVGTDGWLLFVLVAVAVILWIGCALVVHRGYGINLLANLRHRLLDPRSLAAAGAESLPAIERLLQSSSAPDVRLGLTALEAADDSLLAGHLRCLVAERREDMHADLLRRLAVLDAGAAAGAARQAIGDDRPTIRAASISVLGEIGTAADGALARRLLDDPDREVRAAAAATIARLGDSSDHDALQRLTRELSVHHDRSERLVAAQLLVAQATRGDIDEATLERLLADSDTAVASAALEAVGSDELVSVGTTVITLLARRSTAPAALRALVRNGDASLELLDRTLTELPDHLSPAESRRAQQLSARACRDIGSEAAAVVLRNHGGHADRDVGLVAITSLAAIDQPWTAAERDEFVSRSLDHELRHAGQVAKAIELLASHRVHHRDPQDGLAPITAALLDEWRVIRARVVATLAVRHGPEAIGRIAFQLDQPDTRIHALALEWLDVTLSTAERPALAVLDPSMEWRERLTALKHHQPEAPRSAHDTLRVLAADPEDTWSRPWLSACAIAALLSDGETLDDHHLEPWQRRRGGDIVLETHQGLMDRSAT